MNLLLCSFTASQEDAKKTQNLETRPGGPRQQMKPTRGLWSNSNAGFKPKAWLVGSKWRAVIGKQIVSERWFDTKAEALREAARHQERQHKRI
jgi:hypothetical protein